MTARYGEYVTFVPIMLVFMLAVLVVGTTATNKYGCLYHPSSCSSPSNYCHDDGITGHCISVLTDSQHSPYYPSAELELEPAFHANSAKKVQKFSSGSALSIEHIASVVSEVRRFLRVNGYDFSDLTEHELDRLSRAIAHSLLRNDQQEKQNADTELLMAIAFETRDELLKRGITIDQLSGKQVNDLSEAIITKFHREQGTNKAGDAPRIVPDTSYSAQAVVDHDPFMTSRNDFEATDVTDNDISNHDSVIGDVTDVAGSVHDDATHGRSSISDDSDESHMNIIEVDDSAKTARVAAKKSSESDSGSMQMRVDGKSKQNPLSDASQPDSPGNVALAQSMQNVKKTALTHEEVYIIIIVVAVVVIILVITISTVCYCMKSIEQRNKLLGTSSVQSDDDDYQELCRQHYASKSSQPRDPNSETPKQAQTHSSSTSTPTLLFSPVARQHRAQRNQSASSWSEEPVTTSLDISTGHAVLNYMEDHIRNKDRLTKEWESLCKYQADMNNTSVGQANMIRNRTPSTIPYDHNRVKLKSTSSPVESDYINASYIIDNDPRFPVYIAAQGPLSSTIHHFWQMIWEQGCVAIVMLTPVTEDKVSQCARYWPDEGASVYNDYEIHLVSEHIWCEDYLVRSLYLKNLKSSETRTVTQFHFLSWPWKGSPLSCRPLLELRRKADKCWRGSNAPMLVHCSDGSGRTGTYILIDLVISRMLKGVKEMDIAASLEHLRDQRAGMVSSKDQFEFALTSVADEVNAILRTLLH